MPGAEVRLADRGVSAGRDIRAWTDATGRFTLTGLRPGETYTLIAETEDGAAVGRSRIEAPDSRVEIRIASNRGSSSPSAAVDEETNPAAERRVRSISNVRDDSARINLDDLPATTDDSFQEDRPMRDPDRNSSRTSRSGWKSGANAPTSTQSQRSPRVEDIFTERSASLTPDSAPDSHEPDFQEFQELRTPTSSASHAALRDLADSNPLPPAREPLNPSPIQDPDATNVAAEPGALRPADPLAVIAPASSGPVANLDTDSTQTEQEEPGPPTLEGERVTHANGPQSHTDPPAPDASAPARPAEAASPANTVNDALPVPVQTAALPPRPKPTWNELAQKAQGQGQGPANAAAELSQSALRASTAASGTMTFPISTRPRVSARASAESLAKRTEKGTLRDPGRPAPETVTRIQFDAKKRRILDFQLADLEGNPVRFQDLDADFILLDFWGSWCAPCRASIPHLVELQKQYDPRRLKVLGIAYEQGEPMERVRRAEAASQEFGINYPILLAEQDGQPCPLQNALQVDVFPTLVLIDRHGRILWRDKGANPLTLARLDKAIAAQISNDTVRR